jgi:aspartyl-tRNA(Asn)/glutamyl-tRNA(Gln) amidotransferase subunit B
MNLMHVLIKCSNEVIRDNPDKVQQARKRPELAGWFVGQVMKATNGIYSEAQVREVLSHRGIG